MTPEEERAEADRKATELAERQRGDRAQKAEPYRVFDTNQRGEKPREHEVITKVYEDGGEPETMTYKLFSSDNAMYGNKGCPMPQDHAYKFLSDQAFKVIAPNGNRLAPIKKFDPSQNVIELKDDQVIVEYKFLSRDYLMRLVKMLAGSEEVRQNASVEELAEFMVKHRKSLKGMTEGDRAVAEALAKSGGAMNEEEMAKMFGDRKAA